MNHSETQSIVFYDGYCGLCNRAVRFLYHFDRKKRLHFAPLQGLTATQAGIQPIANPDSLLFYQQEKIHRESEAVILASVEMGGFWVIARILLLIPAFLRNAVYRLVAKNRYKWFGRSETCLLLPGDTGGRFLD